MSSRRINVSPQGRAIGRTSSQEQIAHLARTLAFGVLDEASKSPRSSSTTRKTGESDSSKKKRQR